MWSVKVQLTCAPLSINDYDNKQSEKHDLFRAETTKIARVSRNSYINSILSISQ